MFDDLRKSGDWFGNVLPVAIRLVEATVCSLALLPETSSIAEIMVGVVMRLSLMRGFIFTFLLANSDSFDLELAE